MIKHIVMWKLKDSYDGHTAEENGLKMQEMLMSLDGQIPELKKIHVSTTIKESNPECDVVLDSEFDSIDDLSAYANHPKHVACVSFIKSVVENRYVVDYEI
ncbi:MAG: Dabb family protein [Desulfovibrio sp.]